ncbi:hypothetical protein OROMI_033408 [Orobanche minor]
MARAGYDLMEVWEMERKMKKHQEVSKYEEDSVIGPPSPPNTSPNVEAWSYKKTGRGGASYDAAREIVESIVIYTRYLILEGRHYILAATIGRPEHPDRVCGVGFGVGIRDYFGRSRGPTSFVSEDVLEQLRKKPTLDVT